MYFTIILYKKCSILLKVRTNLSLKYIYIYIYIYCHPQIDCFVVSQLFSVARHVRRLKLGSKPDQLYVRLSFLPLSQQAIHVSSGIIRHYEVVFVCLQFDLQDTRVLNSLEEFCFMRVPTINSFARVLKPFPGWAYIYIYIYI